MQNGLKYDHKSRPQIRETIATSGSSDSIDTYVIQKPLDCQK